MEFTRGKTGTYFNKRKYDWEWRYKYTMDDFGNLINIERQYQHVIFHFLGV